MKGEFMKYTYSSVEALMKAFQGGELYGYQPAEAYDATKFAYPVEVKIDEVSKTFKVEQNAEKSAQNEVLNILLKESAKTPFYKKGWFYFALAAAVVVIISLCVVFG